MLKGLDVNEMNKFLEKARNDPLCDIPQEFLNQLSLYQICIESSGFTEIRKNFSYIPSIIKDIIENIHLCSEPKICDSLTNVLFELITKEGNFSDAFAIQTANLLKRINSTKSKSSSVFPSKLVLKAIEDYPDEYVEGLTSSQLLVISLSNPPSYLILAIIKSLRKRDIVVPDNLIVDLDVSRDPFDYLDIFIISYKKFIKNPTLAKAKQIVRAFFIRPQAHLICISDLSNFTKNDIERSFPLIGSLILESFPLDIKLSSLYHPSIEDIVNIYEEYNGNFSDETINLLKEKQRKLSEMQYKHLSLFFCEFPEWNYSHICF